MVKRCSQRIQTDGFNGNADQCGDERVAGQCLIPQEFHAVIALKNHFWTVGIRLHLQGQEPRGGTEGTQLRKQDGVGTFVRPDVRNMLRWQFQPGIQCLDEFRVITQEVLIS